MNYKVISIMLGLVLVLAVPTAFGEEKVTKYKKISKATDKICQTHYKKYKINEQLFIEKFSSKKYYDSCMKLYHDKSWYFKGKAAIDRAYR